MLPNFHNLQTRKKWHFQKLLRVYINLLYMSPRRNLKYKDCIPLGMSETRCTIYRPDLWNSQTRHMQFTDQICIISRSEKSSKITCLIMAILEFFYKCHNLTLEI